MSSVEHKVDSLARRYGLPARTREPVVALTKLLASDPAAPTTVRELDRVLDDHVADALVALELEPVRIANTVADIGSGAGVPGIPLAIAKPDGTFALVESSRRKCAFLTRAISACALDNVEVINARVEDWRAGIGEFELVTARAVAPLEVVAEYAAPLLVRGGGLVVWRGIRDASAEATAAAAAGQLGLTEIEVRAVRPYAGAKARHLHVFMKDKPTPRKFPRRPGMALKRPLGRQPTSI